jgi:biofilm protein TabA
MIYDVLKNAHLYFTPGCRLAKAIDFVRNFNLSEPDGRYEIGDTMYAIVMSYKTKPAEQQKSETHKKYIDIQVVLSGRERIDIALFSDRMVIETPYDEAKDAAFYKLGGAYVPLIMTEGTFAVLYPQDVHRPSCNLDGAADVRKIVVKVQIL